MSGASAILPARTALPRASLAAERAGELRVQDSGPASVLRTQLALCPQAEVVRVDGRVTGLSEATQPLLEAMHRTTTEQKTTFEDRLEKLTKALKPNTDTLEALSVEISSLKSQIQATSLAAASVVAVLGIVASLAGNASAIPPRCFQVGVAMLFAFGIVVAILVRWLWLFVETRSWMTSRTAGKTSAAGAT